MGVKDAYQWVIDNTPDPGGILPKTQKPIKPDMSLGYYGGTPEASQGYRDQMLAGIGSGIGQTSAGMDRMGQAGDAGAGLTTLGQNVSAMGTAGYNEGAGLSNQARWDQARAAGMQRDAAMGLAPSQAQLMLRANADDAARKQMAMASSARGGNQAAAQAAAMANGSQMQLQAGQQAAALRAQEMAQARGAYGDVSGQMRGQDLGLAGLGSGLVGTGLGAQAQGIAAMQNAGAGIANIGANRESNYLSQLGTQMSNEQRSRIDLEMARIAGIQAAQQARQAQQGAVLGAVGTVAAGV